MNRAYGKVLVRESGLGLPDLVVALFDVDVGASAQNPQPNAPNTILRRIGSVLTNRDGEFEITFENAEFNVGDSEVRPDLVLQVFAPEDVVDPNTHSSAPPDQRVLIRSSIPREDAGVIEAYVLRIDEGSLRRHGIALPGDTAATTSSMLSTLSQSASDASELKTSLREKLRDARRAAVAELRIRRETARRFGASLSAMPRNLRDSALFVRSEGDVEPVTRRAMESSLLRLEEVRSSDLLFWTPDDTFATLGLPVPDVDSEFIEVDEETICRLTRRNRAGVTLERVTSLLEQHRRELSARERLEAPADPDGDSDGDGTAPPVEEEPSNQEFLQRAVRRQMSDLAVPPTRPAQSLEELSERLAGVRLPPGPADVSAIHDFHELQVAFRHVWTEAFDSELRATVEDLYDTIAELHSDIVGSFELPVEAGEIAELGELLKSLGAEVDALRLSETAPRPVREQFEDVDAIWPLLSEGQQADLLSVAETLRRSVLVFTGLDRDLPRTLPEMDRRLTDDEVMRFYGSRVLQLLNIYRRGKDILRNPAGRLGRLVRLRTEISERLTERYAFHYFAPDSVNFGIITTYRQTWKPLTYQVGDLVSTVPLAPGEKRTYSSKISHKLQRSQKELEKALSSRSGESTQTQRADSEITAKASLSTAFKHTAQGSFNIGIGSLEASTEFALDQAQESSQVKKDFREAVIKAAQEYKSERTVEVSTSSETTAEHTTSGEIQNPNNEITVTYLFYELERQYRISERLHRVTPVVLVAQDVPAPNQITEAWLIQYAWILKRVRLDDSVDEALALLTDGFAGNELSVNVLRANWEKQKALVGKLEADVQSHRTERDALRTRLIETERELGTVRAGERSVAQDVGAALFTGFLSLFGSDPAAEQAERLEVVRRAIEMQLKNLDATVEEMEGRLSRASDALTTATREYTSAIEAQTNRRLKIDQARMHVKDNILYYMQAIWSHEPPDQRFFRLYDVERQLAQPPSRRLRVRRARPDEVSEELALLETPGGAYYVIEGLGAPRLPTPDESKRRLVEIADLDRPLGFKGNYIIFPLKVCTYLTEFMMRQYVDGYFGARDPDPAAEFSTEELLDYAERILHDPVEGSRAEIREALTILLERRIREPSRGSDIVVVPTGQLFVEALVGTHPLLEQFKLIHRAYDMAKARAEYREKELENLRRAARMLQEVPNLDDPGVDKRIQIEGRPAVTIETE